MHASHAPLFGPGCNGQSWAAGVFSSVLSVKLPALLLLDDAMLSLVAGEVKPLGSFRSVSGLDDVQSLVVVHLPLDLVGLLRRESLCDVPPGACTDGRGWLFNCLGTTFRRWDSGCSPSFRLCSLGRSSLPVSFWCCVSLSGKK